MSIKRVSQLSFNPGPPIQDLPGKVTIGTAVDVGTNRAFGNGAADVTFTRAAIGGIPDTYTVTSNPGGFTATGSSSPLRVTGLTGGSFYTFTVKGTITGIGTSVISDATPSTLITTKPSAPVVGLIQEEDGRDYDDGLIALTVSANSGGSPIQYFTVVATPDPTIIPALPTVTLTGLSPISLRPLKGHVNYTFTVTATNANGTSATTTYGSNVYTLTTPQAPTLDSLTAVGTTGISVAFHANGTGGSAITSYIITYSAADDDETSSEYASRTVTCTSSPYTITKLLRGHKYYIKVQAVNRFGISQYSNILSRTL